jgi:hypothetical protein
MPNQRFLALVIAGATIFAACGTDTIPGTEVLPTPDTTSPDTGNPNPTVPETPEVTVPGDDRSAQRLELSAARDRWAAAGFTSYRFTYQERCFRPLTEIKLEVFEGRLISAPGPFGQWSILEWFDVIDDALDNAFRVDALYDDDWGYPIDVFVDVNEMTADEEFGMERISFSEVPEPVAQFMDVEYGCGFGFWTGSDEQTAGMFVSLDLDFGNPVLADSYDLADLSSAEIRFGADLFANWCDDVIEQDEPTAQIDETWTINGGTVTVTQNSDNSVTGVFADVTAQTPSGEMVELGLATVTNDAWGLFAG